ncbi:13833_t:CDS:2 [Entrophospora sp. SA101]|nr:13833_t:CDS:2 [Entrophospora sp. SA101]
MLKLPEPFEREHRRINARYRDGGQIKSAPRPDRTQTLFDAINQFNEINNLSVSSLTLLRYLHELEEKYDINCLIPMVKHGGKALGRLKHL